VEEQRAWVVFRSTLLWRVSEKRGRASANSLTIMEHEDQRFCTLMVAFLLVQTPVVLQALEPLAQSGMQPL
jgi:hypothetical protein